MDTEDDQIEEEEAQEVIYFVVTSVICISKQITKSPHHYTHEF